LHTAECARAKHFGFYFKRQTGSTATHREHGKQRGKVKHGRRRRKKAGQWAEARQATAGDGGNTAGDGGKSRAMGGSTAGNGRPPRRQSQSRGAGRKKEPKVATPPRRRRESRGAGRKKEPKVATPPRRQSQSRGAGRTRAPKTKEPRGGAGTSSKDDAVAPPA
jgi:hypothetical protein